MGLAQHTRVTHGLPKTSVQEKHRQQPPAPSSLEFLLFPDPFSSYTEGSLSNVKSIWREESGACEHPASPPPPKNAHSDQEGFIWGLDNGGELPAMILLLEWFYPLLSFT